MENLHSHLRLAASLVLAAGLVSACGGGSSGGTSAGTGGDGGTMEPMEPEPMEPTTTRTPEDCTAASPTCTVTETAADGTTTTTVTTNMANTAAMTNTRTVTAGGVRTTTVTSTVEAHANRVMSVETCAVSADGCARMSFTENTYGTADSNTATMTLTIRYTAGRPTSGERMVVAASGTTTTAIAYSSSGGGRTETTAVTGGSRVQTFNMFSGGDATSTMIVSADGRTVTMDGGNMRTQTVYASSERTPGTERTVTTGAPEADSMTGFSGTTTVTTHIPEADRVEVGGRTLVMTVATVTASATTVTQQTYITARDDSGRETRRVTYLRESDGRDGAVQRMVVTTYPTAGGMEVTTTVGAAGSETMTTVATTAANGMVTTVVRDGAGSAPIITTTVRSRADDGTVTVAVTGGPSADTDAGHPAEGTTVTTVTNPAGTRNVATTSTGTGNNRVVSMVVTTDERGAEVMRVMVSNSGNTEARTATAYLPDGGSTVTTATYTRDDADSDWEQTGNRVVVTNDPMGREILSVTTDTDGDETDRRVTMYAADGSSTATRTFSGGTGDMLTDTHIVKRAAPGMGETMGAITDDIVVHPDVQDHAMVPDEQYMMIQQGMAPRENAKTFMGQAILHLDYEDDTAMAALLPSRTTATDVELEMITKSPACAASGGCTYDGFRYRVEPREYFPEIRLYDTASGNSLWTETNSRNEPGNLPSATHTNFWGSTGWYDENPMNSDGDSERETANKNWSEAGRNTETVMIRLLSDLLGVGGGGLAATYKAPSADYAADGPSTGVTGPEITVARADTTALERNTFSYLKTTELPRGVMGIGQQVKEVDSYLRLGGARGTLPADDEAVSVKVENYFGWMENSTFTIHRVTAAGVANSDANSNRYDWLAGAGVPGEANARAYFGMVSGDPSEAPRPRNVDEASGTWTGAMIGVGTVQGERYRGRAMVTVNFANNNVNTAFDRVTMALDSPADLDAIVANPLRLQHVSTALTDGFAFTSDGITNDGSFTSNTMTGGAGYRRPSDRSEEWELSTWQADRNVEFNLDTSASTLSGQFYGPDAAEVAGTFNAHGLALGKSGRESVWGNNNPATDTGMERGDIVGAFGATRDPLADDEN